jgi:hypothetical protein
MCYCSNFESNYLSTYNCSVGADRDRRSTPGLARGLHDPARDAVATDGEVAVGLGPDGGREAASVADNNRHL